MVRCNELLHSTFSAIWKCELILVTSFLQYLHLCFLFHLLFVFLFFLLRWQSNELLEAEAVRSNELLEAEAVMSNELLEAEAAVICLWLFYPPRHVRCTPPPTYVLDDCIRSKLVRYHPWIWGCDMQGGSTDDIPTTENATLLLSCPPEGIISSILFLKWETPFLYYHNHNMKHYQW